MPDLLDFKPWNKTPSQPHEIPDTGERKELDEMLTKLDTFLHGETFSELPYQDRKLLQIQRAAMQAYVDVLDMRIARFT